MQIFINIRNYTKYAINFIHPLSISCCDRYNFITNWSQISSFVSKDRAYYTVCIDVPHGSSQTGIAWRWDLIGNESSDGLRRVSGYSGQDFPIGTLAILDLMIGGINEVSETDERVLIVGRNCGWKSEQVFVHTASLFPYYCQRTSTEWIHNSSQLTTQHVFS